MLVERLFGEEADILYDRSLQLLFGANAIAVLGVALLSPILDSLTGPYGVSASDIGLFVTAIAFPAIFLIPVGGVLADRYGRKPLLLIGLLLFGGAGAAVGLTTDFRIALALRFFQGVGMSAMFPSIVSSLRDLFDDAQEATAQGLRVGVSGTSQALFTTLAGFLVVIAWQYPFMIYALAIPVAILVFIFLEEPMNNGEQEPSNTDAPGFLAYIADVGSILFQRRVAAILFAHTLGFFALFTFMTYNSLIVIRAAGGGPREAGLVVAIFSIVYAGVATQAGRITTRFATRTKPMLLSNVLIGLGLCIFALAPHSAVAGAGAAVLAGGVGIVAPLYRSLISGFAPEKLRGAIVSVGEALGWVAVTTSPIVIGLSISRFEATIGTARSLQLTILTAGISIGILGVLTVLYAAQAPRTAEERALDNT